ncbi:hypothetical protein WJX77_005262 [Trebouxia sp. C0004]
MGGAWEFNPVYYMGLQSIHAMTPLPEDSQAHMRGFLCQTSGSRAVQPNTPANKDSLRKRPRKQRVKSSLPHVENPTNHLRKSRQQDRATDAIPQSTQERLEEQPHAVKRGGGAQQAQPQTRLAPARLPRRIAKAPQSQTDFQASRAAAQEAARVRTVASPSRAAKIITDSKSPTRAGRRKLSSASTSWSGSTKVTDDILAGAALSPFAAVKRASPSTAAAGRPSSSNLSGAARGAASNSPAAAGRRPSPHSPASATPVGSSSSHARPQAAIKLPRHCECCYRTETPTWRIGKRAPYVSADLCNACEMWQVHHPHKSLLASGKVDTHKAEYMSKCVAAASEGASAYAAAGLATAGSDASVYALVSQPSAGVNNTGRDASAQATGEGSNFGVGRRGSHAINADMSQADGMQRWTLLEQHDSSYVQQCAAVPKMQKKRSCPGASRDTGLAARKAGKYGHNDTPVAAVSRQHSSGLTATAVVGLGSSSFADGSLGLGGNDVDMMSAHMGMVESSAEVAISSLGMVEGAAGMAGALEGMTRGRRVYKLRERRTPRLTQLVDFQDDEVEVMECY